MRFDNASSTVLAAVGELAEARRGDIFGSDMELQGPYVAIAQLAPTLLETFRCGMRTKPSNPSPSPPSTYGRQNC